MELLKRLRRYLKTLRINVVSRVEIMRELSEAGFKVKCSDCGKILDLLKDSTEGMRVYCGRCYEKNKK